jgi:hypothetical protein
MRVFQLMPREARSCLRSSHKAISKRVKGPTRHSPPHKVRILTRHMLPPSMTTSVRCNHLRAPKKAMEDTDPVVLSDRFGYSIVLRHILPDLPSNSNYAG